MIDFKLLTKVHRVAEKHAKTILEQHWGSLADPEMAARALIQAYKEGYRDGTRSKARVK